MYVSYLCLFIITSVITSILIYYQCVQNVIIQVLLMKCTVESLLGDLSEMEFPFLQPSFFAPISFFFFFSFFFLSLFCTTTTYVHVLFAHSGLAAQERSHCILHCSVSACADI